MTFLRSRGNYSLIAACDRARAVCSVARSARYLTPNGRESHAARARALRLLSFFSLSLLRRIFFSSSNRDTYAFTTNRRAAAGGMWKRSREEENAWARRSYLPRVAEEVVNRPPRDFTTIGRVSRYLTLVNQAARGYERRWTFTTANDRRRAAPRRDIGPASARARARNYRRDICIY